MAQRAYLRPEMVNMVYERLLQAHPNEAISMEMLADYLAQQGAKNPRTKKPPTRQAVHYVLRHPKNKRGHDLLAENQRRLNNDHLLRS